jgi:cytoskeleton protein RodZ
MSSAAAARGVRVAASHDTWVQIADGAGRRVFSGILGSGEEQAWIASAPYQVKIGNAPGTRLYYRGKPVDLAPYTRGDVATVELK